MSSFPSSAPLSGAIFQKNSDSLDKLPTDVEVQELSFNEKNLVDMLYPLPSDSVKNLPVDTKKAWYHFKDIIVATILFFLLNLPVMDTLIVKIIKKDNEYYKLAAKSVIFAVLFFVINNFYLSKK